MSVGSSISFYDTLSFTRASDWEIAGMHRPANAGPWKRGRGEPAVGALKDAAHRFESSEDCNVRAPNSPFSMKQHALCVVIKSDSGSDVDAAAWIIWDQHSIAEAFREISLSPVVARSPALAREVVSDAIAIWEEQHPSPNGTDVNCQVLRRGRNGRAEETLASLGFRTIYSLQLMRQRFGKKPCPPLPPPPGTYFVINRS